MRMARALGEYEVRGIKTSIPFFRWLLDDEDFREGRFDTTFLDRELARRNGKPFVTVPDEAEHVALLAAAIHAYEGATPGTVATGAGNAPARGWALKGRLDGLR
jgi:pyruvate carboxylase subunit A